MPRIILQIPSASRGKSRVYLWVAIIGFIGCAALNGCVRFQRMSIASSRSVSGVEATYYWGRATFLTKGEPLSLPSDTICNEANDASLGLEYQRYCAALLFGGYVSPGFDRLQMRRAIPNPTWLDSCHLTWIGAVGGNL